LGRQDLQRVRPRPAGRQADGVAGAGRDFAEEDPAEPVGFPARDLRAAAVVKGDLGARGEAGPVDLFDAPVGVDRRVGGGDSGDEQQRQQSATERRPRRRPTPAAPAIALSAST
jgi:hypothetical protein